MKKNINRKLFDNAMGVKLDIGCGQFRQKGFIGMDLERHKNIDITHDIQKFPWPVPSNVCYQILFSHVWEHIEPKHRFRVMDELWRICRWDGQLLIAAPHAGSYLADAHPAHYGCPNEAAFQFFDPDYQLYHSGGYKKPRAWKIVRSIANINGTLEVIMEPRKNKNGKELLPAICQKKADDAVEVKK